MEQMYLIEIFVDKVNILMEDEDPKQWATKKLIIKMRFGSNVQFIIKQGHMSLKADPDEFSTNEDGKSQLTKFFRVGKSYLIPSYPDTLQMLLSKYPLEIELWTDDENEGEKIFIGCGTMVWHTGFYHMLRNTADICVPHEPLSVKDRTTIFAECCCKIVGEIASIIRISAIGSSVVTDFQQLMDDPEVFYFKTDKAPSKFECKRIEPNDEDYITEKSIYELTVLENPDVLDNFENPIDVCTELQSCAVGIRGVDTVCNHDKTGASKLNIAPLDKIRMGDIKGPCGNTNCPLAHRVKQYIRSLDIYKKPRIPFSEIKETKKGDVTKKICGACDCIDDRWHLERLKEQKKKEEKKQLYTPDGKPICKGCGGIAQVNETCADQRQKLYGTGVSPTTSPKEGSVTNIHYLTHITRNQDLMESMYGKDFYVGNVEVKYDINENKSRAATSCGATTPGCSCAWKGKALADKEEIPIPSSYRVPEKTRSFGFTNSLVYNVENSTSKPNTVKAETPSAIHKFCIDMPKDADCRCDPPKKAPPCKTVDCECLTRTFEVATRKMHKPFCPSYKHKKNCLTIKKEDDELNNENNEEEVVAEKLPYGLPPIKLGPCPVLGRPCSVPDGFNKMYKTAAMTPLPPSYTDAGKVCCSKEFERIKKALKEYMNYQKQDDMRCINRYNVDTERRCCDKDQALLVLMGKGCCGMHKLSIQDEFKDQKK